MTTRTIVLSALASLTLITTALADDRTYLTPPLYREQARATATVRPASELITTPFITPRAPATRQLVAKTAEASVR
ncbi:MULTISPECIES: hypothetical protein [unclassified Methylobacterium]|uniref:hypothetical protein n=1 Tax=unclassified Methylobacterium TaxID=2615210 RepID=UPI00070056EE|nr:MULTISPECIES: hypothetical protein [unclassified Methylobacterium]KQP73700.1 hypothetical protein ASF60_09700 [Methylobacterium sp. Leaf113]KQP96355.1 hypothetical protein ASF57_00945 [Methylobacterium sp. Leaf117]MCK2053946.1 hypothetical protein [Methylobacterium sp. 37f]